MPLRQYEDQLGHRQSIPYSSPCSCCSFHSWNTLLYGMIRGIPERSKRYTDRGSSQHLGNAACLICGDILLEEDKPRVSPFRRMTDGRVTLVAFTRSYTHSSAR